MNANPSGWLLPDLEEPTTAEFWNGCARGELLVQACGSCGARRMPPRPMCPVCRSIDVTWESTSGRGRIWSYIVSHPPLLPAYAQVAPYNAIVVELEEDPSIRFAGNLVASAEGSIGEIDPSTIVIGEPVRVVFHQIDDVTLPRWVRAG
jgi:uncharacterized OB-fold protein